MLLPPPVPVRLTTLPSHDCNYLPGRQAVSRAFQTQHLSPALYHQFMEAGFRRSGLVVYQPVCKTCSLCVPIRVPVDRFKPDKSQRRCIKENADLMVSIDRPGLNDEKLDLYQRYVAGWHGRTPTDDDALDRQSLQSFLYDSPVDTLEFSYRSPDGELLAVGIVDICPQSLSSVYFYFDPDSRNRGLGTFGAVTEIHFAARQNIPHYLLGFWIKGCGAMEYKSRFKPCQILDENGAWQEM